MAKKTVLIVDDDRSLVGALKTRCRRLGVNVVTAYDALAAVFKVREALPDVVCLDLSMPGGDGLHVCEMLSFDAQKKHFPVVDKPVPIIALTARTDCETIKACHRMGVYYVLKSNDVWGRVEPLLRELLEMEDVSQTPNSPDGGLRSRRLSRPLPPSAAVLRIPPAVVSPDERADPRPWHAVERSAPPTEDPAQAASIPAVLVIEDDLGVVNTVRHFLAKTGAQVLHCDNLRDARRLATQATAVLCDVHLSHARGTFIIRELRDEGFEGDVLVITADGRRSTVIECARAGADGILLKPFTRKDLLRKLAGLSDNLPATETAGTLPAEL